MKAQDEHEALEHMEAMFKRGGRMLSGRSKDWVLRKVEALNALLNDHGNHLLEPRLSFLDLGVGDMAHWERWAPFMAGAINYTGLDGCQEILDDASSKHPDLTFINATFSEVVDAHDAECRIWPVDCIVALDVLYHVPDDEVHDGMLRVLFGDDAQHKYVLVSYALDPGQRFDGAGGVGQPGFAWFPREWQEPMGWDLLNRADFSQAGGPQRQQLSLYKRVA